MSKINSLFLFMLIIYPLYSDYPQINYTLASKDNLFSQQQQDIQDWYAGNENDLSLNLYKYIPNESENLFSVASSFNLPYETLATLNSIDAPVLFQPGKEIYIPNIPGIFVPEVPTTDLEKKLELNRKNEAAKNIVLKLSDDTIKKMNFYPGSKFSSQERIRFLGNLFTVPIIGGKLTSGYGYRTNPFTGKIQFHKGIDLEIEQGAPVYAAMNGIVTEIGILEIYGNYVIIDHPGKYQTFYSHLLQSSVVLNQEVKAGDIIALSGNSGVSTGPHLHFEIRHNGRSIDPLRLIAIEE